MHTQFTTEPPFVTTCMALDLSHWCSKSTCFTTAIPWRMKQQLNTQTHFVITPLPHTRTTQTRTSTCLFLVVCDISTPSSSLAERHALSRSFLEGGGGQKHT